MIVTVIIEKSITHHVFSGQMKSTFTLVPFSSRMIEGHDEYPLNFENTISPTLNLIVEIFSAIVQIVFISI